MKKLILVFSCLLLFAFGAYAQLPDITQVEYFFDTDPGPGNGTAISISADSIIDASFNADISGLDVGRHLLYIRTLDENGKWSLPYIFNISKAAAPPAPIDTRPDIVSTEYFFDTDPGPGNGTEVSITADSIISESFNADVSGLDVGRHLLYLRTLDENGKWSLPYIFNIIKPAPAPSPLYLDPLPDMVAAEYFFDTDPGHGNGTAVSFTADSLISESFNADITGLDVGRHLLYVRTLDENGKWSLAYIFDINKAAPSPSPVEPRADLVAVEYFFNTDPGPGNGTAVSITSDSIISESFNADITGLDVGRQLMYVRTMDENEKWSLASVFDINKAAPSPVNIGPRTDIVAVEYFFNTDPGPGNGTAVSIISDSLISESFSADITGLDVGRHLLYIRTMDEDKNWSLAYVFDINKIAPSPQLVGPRPDIVAMEYFYNTDPGTGSGTHIAISQDSIVDVDFMLDLSTLELGEHLVYIRALDETGRWSVVDINVITKRLKRILRHGQFFYNDEIQPIVKP